MRCTMSKGYTLIELLIVITIIGVVGVISFPIYLDVKHDSDAVMKTSKISMIEAAGRKYGEDRLNSYSDCPNDTKCCIKSKYLYETKYLDDENVSGAILITYDKEKLGIITKYYESEDCDLSP